MREKPVLEISSYISLVIRIWSFSELRNQGILTNLNQKTKRQTLKQAVSDAMS